MIMNFILHHGLKPDRQKVAYKLLYVLCSRAKERLYLISETGRVTKNRYKHYSITDEIDNIKWNYN